MRTANLLIICGALLSLGVPLIKAEVEMGESLWPRGRFTRRTSGLQRMPKVRAREVIPEGDMPTHYSRAQQSRRMPDQRDETDQGEAHQPLLRRARQLTGSSSRSSSSSSSSSSRSSSSSSSSRSSSSSSSSSPSRSSWSSWFSPSSGSRSSSPGATQTRAAPAVPSKPAQPSQSKSAGQGNAANAAKGNAQPRSSYVPPSYHGPTVRSTSGATAVSNRLTTGYPTAGVSSRIPRGPGFATSAPRQTFNANRPYTHTYPHGYTLVFVSAHSPYYTGNHWAIYDSSNDFYGYDDNDMTAGDYDYDDDHNLPAGCQYLDPQSSETINCSSDAASAQAPGPAGADGSGHVSAPAPAPGSAVAAGAAPVQATAPSANTGRRAVLSVSPSYLAPAPAPGMAPGNATSANATGGAALSGGTADMQGQGNLLCRPIAAKEDAPSGMSRNTKIIIGVVVPVGVLLVVFCIWCACRR